MLSALVSSTESNTIGKASVFLWSDELDTDSEQE